MGDAYHDDLSHWTKSLLWAFIGRRTVAKAILDGTAPQRKATTEMDVGSVVHFRVLQPHRLAEVAIREPRQKPENNGHIHLLRDDFDRAKIMADQLLLSLQPFNLSMGVAESPIYWRDEITGVPCKCRPDWLYVSSAEALIIDVKTTKDIKPRDFKFAIQRYGYWLQDAHYRAGVRATYGVESTFLFACVESEWPYQVALYCISDVCRERWSKQYRTVIHDVATCIDTGDWREPWARDIYELGSL